MVEVVVTTIIIVVVLIPISSNLLNGHNLVYKTRDYLTANNLVTQAAEQVKAAPFGSISPDGTTLGNYPDTTSKFQLRKRIQTLPNTNAKLKRVDLAVYLKGQEMADLSLVLYEMGL